MTDDVEVRARAVLRAAAALGGRAHRELGLGPTDLSALQLLDALAGTPVAVGRLSATLGLSSAATTELVDRLERAGLLRRERDPGDRRRTLVVLEPGARDLGERLLGPWQERLAAATRELGPDGRVVVARFLDRLLGA